MHDLLDFPYFPSDERAAATAALMRYEFKFVYSSLSSYISVLYYTPAKFSAKKRRLRRGGGGGGLTRGCSGRASLAAILSDLVSGLAAVGPLLQLAREVQSSELSDWYQGQSCTALRQPVPTSVAVRRRRWSEVDRHAHYTVSPIFARGFAATTL